jgi:hypothetical protein
MKGAYGLWVPLVIGLYLLTAAVWLAGSECRTRAIRDLFRRFLARPAAETALIAFLVFAAVHAGSTKPPGGTNGTPSSASVTNTAQWSPSSWSVAVSNRTTGALTLYSHSLLSGEGGTAAVQRLTAAQYAARFALVGVRTNPPTWFSVPSNAVACETWSRWRGVAEDTFFEKTNGWSFVLGSDSVDGVHVSSSGTLSFGWPKGSPRAAEMPDGTGLDFLAPLQGPFGIVPPSGRFWRAVTDSNSVLFTWENAYAGRDTNSPVTFQAELFWNGDFAYRYAVPSNSSLFLFPSSFTNFAIGAQRGGGETYALNETGKLADGLELRWRAFGVLGPDDDDPDGDGLPTYDELTLHGTDPLNADSDFDGLEDDAELAGGTGPMNPDTDGDGLADGIDPHPGVWDDADADADGDGYPLWQELFYGMSDTVSGDVALLFGTDGRSVDFTVSGNVPPAAVLTVGGFPVPLAGRTAFSLKFAPETVGALRLANAPGVSVAVRSRDCAALSGATGGLAPGGGGPGTASLAFPVVRIGNAGVLCLHGGDTGLTARVTAGMPGRYAWSVDGIPLDGEGPGIGQEGVPSGTLSVSFYPEGGVPSGDAAAGLSAGGGGAARHSSRSLSSAGGGSPCSCGASFTRCKRGTYCFHGILRSCCPECAWAVDNFWCNMHGEPKATCPCLTVEGGGFLPPGGAGGISVGSPDDSDDPLTEHCCECAEHLVIVLPSVKVNVVRKISSFLTLRRGSGSGGAVSEGERLEGPDALVAQGTGLSEEFGDACAAFSQESHPEKEDWEWACYTVAAIGLEPDSLSEEGRCLIRGGVGCASRVAVATRSALTEGSVSLSSGGGGLFFSESQGAQASSALTLKDDSPPASVSGSRDFWLGATNGGLHTLSYSLLDPDRMVCRATNISVEVVMAKFVTNAYYAAYGATDYFDVTLDPVSHDPHGYTLYIDGTRYNDGLPPWPVSVNNLTAGAHTLTVRPWTFMDVEDSATLNVVKVELVDDETTVYNFSPSLGETANILANVTPAPPAEGFPGYHFSVQIVREIEGNGEQPIDWLDVTDEAAYGCTRKVDFSSKSFTWSGIPGAFGASADPATGRDAFTGVAANASRLFPAVTIGQCVPPPFVTAVAKIICDSDGTVMCEARKRIFVQQVVKIAYDADAVTMTKAGKITNNTNGVPVYLISPMSNTEWTMQKGRIRSIAQTYYDATGANVRFVDEDVAASQPFSTMRMTTEFTADYAYGSAPDDFLNVNACDDGELFNSSFQVQAIWYYNANPTMTIPITTREVGNFWAHVITHECGHMFGLVAPGDILNGSSGGTEVDPGGWHNMNPIGQKVMNPGGSSSLEGKLGREGDWYWKSLNANYLKFVLPKSE